MGHPCARQEVTTPYVGFGNGLSSPRVQPRPCCSIPAPPQVLMGPLGRGHIKLPPSMLKASAVACDGLRPQASGLRSMPRSALPSSLRRFSSCTWISLSRFFTTSRNCSRISFSACRSWGVFSPSASGGERTGHQLPQQGRASVL